MVSKNTSLSLNQWLIILLILWEVIESQSHIPYIHHVPSWPGNVTSKFLGIQVPGVAATAGDTVLLFDRVNVKWGYDSFDRDNNYLKRNKGPIKKDTIHVVNYKTGEHISSWGSNLFYMPHGITVDPLGSVWVTDVALHQVFRFSKDNHAKPDLVLGEAFVPGDDHNHFCKPTDVAISTQGIVFISDGYCNSRVMVYSYDGDYIGYFGRDEDLQVPHGLALVESKDMICVAGRENREIFCYTAGLMTGTAGQLLFKVSSPQVGRVYAVHVLDDRWILALIGPYPFDHNQALTIDMDSQKIVGTWGPTSHFSEPHDLTVTPDGNTIIVCDIRDQRRVFKFSIIRSDSQSSSSNDSPSSLVAEYQSPSQPKVDSQIPSVSSSKSSAPSSSLQQSVQSVSLNKTKYAPSPSKNVSVIHHAEPKNATSSSNPATGLHIWSAMLPKEIPIIRKPGKTSLTVAILAVPVLFLVALACIITRRGDSALRRGGSPPENHHQKPLSAKSFYRGLRNGVGQMKGWTRPGYISKGSSSNNSSGKNFDLNRLLGDDPSKEGFNRIPMDESEIDADNGSDSDIEEFNVTTAMRHGRC